MHTLGEDYPMPELAAHPAPLSYPGAHQAARELTAAPLTHQNGTGNAHPTHPESCRPPGGDLYCTITRH